MKTAGVDAPRIGLVTDDDLHRHILQTLLIEQGYNTALSSTSERLEKYVNSNRLMTVDGWLVDVVNAQSHDAVELLLEKSDLPLLVNDDIPDLNDTVAHGIWRRRLIEKLEVVITHNTESEDGDEDESQNTVPIADTVWVLAASLGGPDAVKSFLTALPPGLPIAMVYVQHIEANFDVVLANAVGASHSYSMSVVKTKQKLVPGEVAIVPADRQLRFLPYGQMVATRKPWSGLYKPAIDQVISDLARIYRKRLGVIVFSGLCNDGEIGCRVAKACGATVWAQTPESCQSPDMPLAAIGTDCVSQQGTPEQLANALAKQYDEATQTF